MNLPICKTAENQYISARYILSESRTFIMGIAMISIILFHQYIVSPSGINIITIFHLYGHWGVDIFLFLSGFGCAYAIQKYTTTVFYKKRLFRIIPTCLIVGILVVLADNYLSAEVVKTYLPIRILSLHRWYIQAIVTLYLLSPLFCNVISRWKVIGLFCLILLAIVIGTLCTNRIGCFKIGWIPQRTPIFLIGVYIGIHDLKITKMEYILSFLCICLTLFLHRYLGNIIWVYSLLAFAIPCICVCIAKLKKYCEKVNILKPIEIMGIYSLEIYLIHEYLLWSLSHSPYSTVIKVIIFIVILIIGCKIVKIITSYLTNKIFSSKN